MKKLLLLLVVGMMLIAGCGNNSDIKSSGNTLARKGGFSGSVNLPPGMKLVNVTYKEDSMWLLYRPMRVDEIAETYTFAEDSRWGLIEGRVEIREKNYAN